MPAANVIKLRRGTAAQWTSANPVLADGEPGWETDTDKLKVGDGTTAWAALDYFVTAPANMVTTDTAQTITGFKTFRDAIFTNYVSLEPPGPTTEGAEAAGSLEFVGKRFLNSELTTEYWGLNFEREDDRWELNVRGNDGVKMLRLSPQDFIYNDNRVLTTATGVTTDTAQTITGAKTFTELLVDDYFSVGGDVNAGYAEFDSGSFRLYSRPATAGETAPPASLQFFPRHWDGATSVPSLNVALTASSPVLNDPRLTCTSPFYALAMYDNNNRVYSAANLPPAPSNMVTTDTTQTVSGDKDFTGALTKSGSAVVVTSDARLSDTRTPTDNTVSLAKLTATGTQDATTFLRGDNTFAVPAAPANMVTTSGAQSITGTKTFGSGRLVVNDGTDDLLRVSTIDGMTVQTSGVFPLTVGRTVLASAGEPFINAAIQGKTAYWTGFSSSSTTWVGLTFAHRSASANDRVVRAGSSLEVNGASSATGAALRVNNNTAAQDIVDFRDSTGVARMTVSNAGVLNASSQVQENGVRVYSSSNKVPVAGLSATGTPSSTTFLRGDNTFAVPAAPSNMVTTDTQQTVSGDKDFTGALTKSGSAVVVTSDARLSDTRTPTDNTVSLAKLTATGTKDATTFLRGDNTWAAPAAPTATVTSVTSAHTAVAGSVVLANGTFAVTLPAVASGAQVIVKNTGTGVVTVTRGGASTIDGATTFVLDIQYASVTVVSDGTNWFVI